MPSLPVPVKCNTVGGSMNAGPLLTTWTDEVTIPHFESGVTYDPSAIGNNFYVDTYTLVADTIVPAPGSAHPVYQHTYCSNVRGDPLPGTTGPSPVGAKFLVDWMVPTGLLTTSYAKHELSVDPYQLQEVRNFDRSLRKTAVLYAIPNLNLTMYFPPYRIADIRVPRTMHCLTITQYEDINQKSAADLCQAFDAPIDSQSTKQPFFNDNEWYGFPPNWLLWIGTHTNSGGLPIARRTYKFLVNDRGWNKFIAVYTQQNGYVPRDLPELDQKWLNPAQAPTSGTQEQNGIGVFNMLDENDFENAFPLINTNQ